MAVQEKRELWREDGPLGPGRLSTDDPELSALVNKLGGDAPVVDLGGTMSVNLHLVTAGLVLRVHQPFVSRRRVLTLRELRQALGDEGLRVPVPRGEPHRVRGRWAELETFVAHQRQPPAWSSYRWMYGAMARLHRALAGVPTRIPRPVVATYATPSSLRRWAALTADAVRSDPYARDMAASLVRMVGRLERQWVPTRAVPNQLIHGDVRLSNVGLAPDDAAVVLDFGFVATRPRIYDFAYALSWMVLRPDASGTGEAFPWDKVPELISAYEEGAGSRLTPAERQAILPYLAAVPLYLASIAGFMPDPVRQLVGEQRFLDIADWVFANPDALAT